MSGFPSSDSFGAHFSVDPAGVESSPHHQDRGFGLKLNTFEPKPQTLGPISQIPPSISLTGIYSATGFDILGILSWVVHRPNPRINIGPVDLSCSFVVSDPRKADIPIVYVSETFTKLTGYSEAEILNKSCRFLQSPDGKQEKGEERRYTDNGVIASLRQDIADGKECQYTVINYKKTGEPFINLLTVVPVELYRPGEISFFVGFQVDLVDQPQAILDRMKDGTYTINYQMNEALNVRKPTSAIDLSAFQADAASLFSALPDVGNVPLPEVREILVDKLGDFVHILSLRGRFLYVAPSSTKQLLEYEPEEVMGHNLHEFVHPADIVFVMRELRNINPGDTINIICRYRRKTSGYIYLEVTGHMYSGDKNKRTKCFILTGREKTISSLNVNDVLLPGRASSETWVKLSLEGLTLFGFSSSPSLLGSPQEELLSTAFVHCLHESDQPSFTEALERAVARESTENVRCRLSHKRGGLPVVIRLYAAGSAKLRTLFCQIKMVEIGGTDPLDLKSLADYGGLYEKGDLFDVMHGVRATSLPYELNQLRVHNKRIREELDSLAAWTKNKQPSTHRPESVRIPDAPPQCQQCHTQTSTEWRKGPDNQRSLCNACGLRYAKMLRRTEAPAT
ncbi:blue light receptor [Thoreauomyces humboldtii]|nr:blue light receptor [Thoreauomyces humboldtii]